MITFEIESVNKAEAPLETIKQHKIFEKLILNKVKASANYVDQDHLDAFCQIVAQNDSLDDLVYMGNHAFIRGMHRAYAEHRPFSISPDMIWLLISQGFAKHINNNSEKFRHHFTHSDQKEEIIFEDNRIRLCDPESPWEELFPQFMNEFRQRVGDDLVDCLEANFSTTGLTEKIASQITIMEALKSYYEYIQSYCICGIPELTIEGTKEDWQEIIKKLEGLRKYELDWWIDGMIPLLEEFVNVFEGTIIKTFWQHMFKMHSEDYYGAPDIVDGWILKFYPYLKNGEKLGESIEISFLGPEGLSEEFVVTDFKQRAVSLDGSFKDTPLELWAGFIGLEQNKETLGLRPKIGWMIRKDNHNDLAAQLKLKGEYGFGLTNLDHFPMELLELNKIDELQLCFKNKIEIPKAFKNTKIKIFTLYGKINFIEKYRLFKLFPNTHFSINGKSFGLPYDKDSNTIEVGAFKRLIYLQQRKWKDHWKTLLVKLRIRPEIDELTGLPIYRKKKDDKELDDHFFGR